MTAILNMPDVGRVFRPSSAGGSKDPPYVQIARSKDRAYVRSGTRAGSKDPAYVRLGTATRDHVRPTIAIPAALAAWTIASPSIISVLPASTEINVAPTAAIASMVETPTTGTSKRIS